MKSAYPATHPRLSLQPTASAVLGLCTAFLVFAVVTNPLAVVIPLAGTLAAVGLVWSIDRLQP